MTISAQQIKDFVGAHELGIDVFINRLTGEVIELPNIYNGAFTELDEFHQENLEKVEVDWHEFEKIECPNSTVSYQIMVSFMEHLPFSHLRSELTTVLLRRKPFKYFNQLIHNSEMRETWFEYRADRLHERVIRLLDEASIKRN